ncbi:unnamed protein product [Brachionus calyciflorus]|uniref:G-protein coupled receptors family 2 profile 2 domain-containing protein n=1 Tax=Brachionus calyciflorus TaxID=104777 RepID=A0A814CAZ5_9BILA|nr:unnamed protein product [Brachionus calyciflorus]
MLKNLIIIFNLFGAYLTQGICHDFCNESEKTIKNCFCTECEYFDDCCSDAVKNRTFSTNYGNYECNSQYNENEFIYTLGKCLKSDTSLSLKTKCESIGSNLLELNPVYTNQTKLFYKNIYCLLCNVEKIDIQKLKIFKIIFPVPPLEINATILNLNSSFVIKKPDNIPEPRKCVKGINTCPSNYTNQLIRNSCESYTAYRFDRFGIVYKNEYCAECNFINESVFCFSRRDYPDFNGLQILFDLTSLGNTLELKVNFSDDFNKHYTNTTIHIELMDKKVEHELPIKKYLTITGHLVSIISLAILILYYIFKKLYKNTPGLILLNLSFTLMISQIFFAISLFLTYSNDFLIFTNLRNLFEEINKVLLCFINGLLVHYFYLCFFFWSNILAFDLFNMFKQSSLLTQVKLEKNLISIYCLYGWLTPFVIVLIMNLKNYQTISYGYKKCFISSSLDLLLFFVIPVGLIILVNLIFVILSIRLVLKIDKLCETFIYSDVDSKKSKRRFTLFLKMFIITGLAWLFGIVCSINVVEAGILGLDFLKKFNAVIDYANDRITIRDGEKDIYLNYLSNNSISAKCGDKFIDERKACKELLFQPNGTNEIFKELVFGKCLSKVNENGEILIMVVNMSGRDVVLDEVLGKVAAANLKLRPSKCKFVMDEVGYLGFKITKYGLGPDPAKTAAEDFYSKFQQNCSMSFRIDES